MLAFETITIPPPCESDGDDVHDALTVACGVWGRGDPGEALRWLRRAAEAAADNGDDRRSLALYKVAADVANLASDAVEQFAAAIEAEAPTWKLQSAERRVVKSGVRPPAPPRRVTDHEAASNDNAPSDLGALKELYRRTGEWAEQSAPAPAPFAPIQKADPERTITDWRRRLEDDPRDVAAMAELEHLLRARERWEDVADVKMMRAAVLVGRDERVREYLEAAHVWEHRAGNEDRAAAALEEVMQLDGSHQAAFEQLEQLYRAAFRWDVLVELYLNRIDTCTELSDQTSLLRHTAAVLNDHLQQPEQAFDALTTAFELDFSDDVTVSALETLATATNRWPRLVKLASDWLGQAVDPQVQLMLSLRLAKWYGDDLDRPEYAQALYAKVADLDPSNAQALRQMAGYVRKEGDWRQAGLLLEQAQRVATRPQDVAAICTDLGDLLERVAEQEEKRVACYQRALAADGSYVPALSALAAMYDARDMTAELVDVLGKKANALKEGSDACEARLQQASLLELVLGKPDAAIDAYRQVLDADAASALAMRGLARVYRASQKWTELSEVLEMHLDLTQSERERTEVLLQIAQLEEEQFLRPDAAAQRLERVVEIYPANSDAFEALARCYRKLRQWRDLIDCLQRSVKSAGDIRLKIELLMQVAQIHEEQLHDQERALDVFVEVTRHDSDYVPALEALAKLYERCNNPAQAIAHMARVADLTADGAQRVEALYAIGRQLHDDLGKRDEARARFEQALDLDPTHLATLKALRDIAVVEGDWDLVARHLDTEQQHTEAPRRRSRLLTELGRLRAEQLAQPDAALAAYQSAHDIDPDNEEAALCLARRHVQEGHLDEAAALTEKLLGKRAHLERSEQIEVNLLHAHVAMELGHTNEALTCYQAARKLDVTNQSAVRGLAEANFRLGDWAGALTNFRHALAGVSDDDAAARTELYFKLGCVKGEQGQNKAAINLFDKALKLDAHHRDTLEALARLFAKLGDWTQSCAYRVRVLEDTLEADQRYTLLCELGAIWNDEVCDPKRALEAYEQAAELKPDDHRLLHKMLLLYQDTSQWDPMIDVLQRIAARDPKPRRRARYLFTMGQVYRDKLHDQLHAAELFDEALDLDPDSLDAFERIHQIYSSCNEWRKLERSYRKMLHRIADKGQHELEHHLWHTLGLIFRDHLGAPDEAREAFGAALRAKPEALGERQILAELAQRTGRVDDAVAHYRALIDADPTRVDSYRDLYELYLQQEAYDEAWCCAAVLSFVGRANDREQRFFDDWRPRDVPNVTTRLDSELWAAHIRHKDEDPKIGKIFAAVTGAALKAKIETLKLRNALPVLPAHAKQTPQTSTLASAQAFWWAARVLAVRPPDLFVCDNVDGGVMTVPAWPPASVAGRALSSCEDALERAFVVGQHLAENRSDHCVRLLFPTQTELTVMLFAAIRLVAPQTPAPQELAAQVEATMQALARFSDATQREQLRYAVNDFLKAGGQVNIRRWSRGVGSTAARAGLLLSGDLCMAMKVLTAQRTIPGDLTADERLVDLMRWFVSDAHFTLRRKLGITLDLEEV